MSQKIFVGFELKTGEKIETFLSHLVVTGLTQLSGKTTTLEALIKRSELRAIAFKTKRGEEGFSEGTIIRPFFKEKSDWQFVSSLLEATMKEKLKFERSWIIRACKGTKNLIEVYEKCKELQENSREGSLQQGVYTNLIAYFELILPQIKDINFSTELNLKEGINIMDLEDLSTEVQSLIIRSTLDYVLNNEKGVIVIIPEFWKFCPQQRGNPVKQIAEEFIRQGATRKNYLWADSQDLANIDKTILKQVANWILGLQTEINEVQHTLEQIPLPNNLKPKEDEIMTLKIGHFIICNPYFTKKIYVCPAWLDEETAKKIALGIIPVEAVLGKKKIKIKDLSRTEEIALENSRQKEIEMSKKITSLEKEIDDLREIKDKLEKKSEKNFSANKQQQEKLKIIKKIQMKYNLLVKKIKEFAEKIENIEEIEIIETPKIEEQNLPSFVPISQTQIQISPETEISGERNLILQKLGGMARKIYETLLLHREGLTKVQVGLMTGYSYTSGSFANALTKLRRMGLITKEEPFKVILK
jgi:hypothetical protein